MQGLPERRRAGLDAGRERRLRAVQHAWSAAAAGARGSGRPYMYCSGLVSGAVHGVFSQHREKSAESRATRALWRCGSAPGVAWLGSWVMFCSRLALQS